MEDGQVFVVICFVYIYCEFALVQKVHAMKVNGQVATQISVDAWPYTDCNTNKQAISGYAILFNIISIYQEHMKDVNFC